MERKTTQRVIGILVAVALIVILMPLILSKNELTSQIATIKAPPFPDQPTPKDISVNKDSSSTSEDVSAIAKSDKVDGGSSVNNLTPSSPSSDETPAQADHASQNNPSSLNSESSEEQAVSLSTSSDSVTLPTTPSTDESTAEKTTSMSQNNADINSKPPNLKEGATKDLNDTLNKQNSVKTSSSNNETKLSQSDAQDTSDSSVSPKINSNQAPDSSIKLNGAKSGSSEGTANGSKSKNVDNTSVTSSNENSTSAGKVLNRANAELTDNEAPADDNLSATDNPIIKISNSDSAGMIVNVEKGSSDEPTKRITSQKVQNLISNDSSNNSVKKTSPHVLSTTKSSLSSNKNLPHSDKKWVIQMGSFKNKENAHRLANQLRSSGYKAFMREVKSAHGTVQTRVYIGPESQQASASKLSTRVEQQLNLHGFVTSFQPFEL